MPLKNFEAAENSKTADILNAPSSDNVNNNMKTIKVFGINLGGELKRKGDEKLLEAKGEILF